MQFTEEILGKPSKKVKLEENNVQQNFTLQQKYILNMYLDSFLEYPKRASVLIQHQENSLKHISDQVKQLFIQFGQNNRIIKCVQRCKINATFLEKFIIIMRKHVNEYQQKNKKQFELNQKLSQELQKLKQQKQNAQNFKANHCKNEGHSHNYQVQMNSSTVFSVFNHICRQWSLQQKQEIIYIEYVKEQVKDIVSNIKQDPSILVLGSGMGKILKQIQLALINLNKKHVIQGHEQQPEYYLLSQYLLNYCKQSFYLYPNVHNFSNSLFQKTPYDQIEISDFKNSQNGKEISIPITFGAFQSLYKSHNCQWNIIITTFYNYSIRDVLKYLQIIYKILKNGGIWIDVSTSCFDKNVISLSYKQYQNILQKSMFKLLKKFDREEKWYYSQKIMMNQYRKVYYRIMQKE